MTVALDEAYRATHYLINEPRITTAVDIGLASLALGRLLDRHGASSGVFLTAWNPRSQKADRAGNRKASAELAAVLDRHGHRFLPAINLAADPDWTEESFFVLDISVEEALMLARAYGQNAVVMAERVSAARLLWAEPPSPKKNAASDLE